MAILSKGQTFGSTEQITSGKLHALVDSATFVTGGSGTCETGGGLEVTSNGRLGIQDGEVDLVKLSTNNALNSGLYGVLDKVYPIGSIYISTSQATSPDNLFFGGTGLTTWEAYATGRTLIGVGTGTDNQPSPQTTTFGAGDTEGQYRHTLTHEESGVPAHNHIEQHYHSNGSGDGPGPGASCCGGAIENAGVYTLQNSPQDASTSHDNMMPYIVTYMWKRTA